MKNSFFYTMVAILFLLVISNACKKREDPLPPCEDYADFGWYQKYSSVSPSTRKLEDIIVQNEDTIMTGSVVTFQAKVEGADEYEWQIGNEAQTRKGKTTTVAFWEWPIDQPTTLTIKLRVKYSKRPDCPNGNGQVWSIKEKKIVFLPSNQWPMLGRYLTYNQQNQPQIIEIVKETPPGHSTITYVKGLVGDENCQVVNFPIFDGSTAFTLSIDEDLGPNDGIPNMPNENNCRVVTGRMHLDDSRNILYIYYLIRPPDALYPLNYFKEKKLVAYRMP